MNYGGKAFLVKKRICTECSDYEYKAGIKIDHNNVMRTYAYVETKEHRYFILEFIKGETTNLSSKSILKQLLYILGDIQTYNNFTHYDLHPGNIMMIKLDQKRQFTYRCFGENRSIESDVDFKIIDLGYSHVNGITYGWLEEDVSAVNLGAVVSVFDPLFDFVTLYGSYRFKILPDKETEELDELLYLQNFVPSSSYEHVESNEYIGRERAYHKNTYELYDFQPPGRFNLMFYSTDLSTQQTIEKLLSQIGTIPEEYKERWTVREYYLRELGAIFHRKKKERMSQRTLSPSELFMVLEMFAS
jgi:hypothetical protein